MPKESVQELAASLHPLERKALPFVVQKTPFADIVRKSGLKDVEAMRALQWLQNKGLVQIYQDIEEFVVLGVLGQKYKKEKLPERKFLDVFEKDKKLLLKYLSSNAGLDANETNTVMGKLKQANVINISKEQIGIIVELTDFGKSFLKKKLPAESFLENSFPLLVTSLNREEKEILQSLQKRKDIVGVELAKQVSASILPLGRQVVESSAMKTEVIDALTPQVLRTGDWQKKNFRKYDVTVNVPKIFAGKHQHYRKFLDGIREKFMSLGFMEMTGPIVETDFWDMDALFMPQFHSARDIHDAYFVKEPKKGKLDEKFVKAVKKVHEQGWKYDFNAEQTKRLLLRTQGTACSARMLASPDIRIPGKYFGITRCFRKDVIDATHLADFHQTEGIIVEEGLTLRHLFGLLQMFAKEFAGAEEIKLVPGYFPFTEPSVELYAKHPQLGWVELGGAGIFRSEVVAPLLGRDVSVIAWGIGIDRIGMFRLGLSDVRDLFSRNLNTLRNAKVV
ncbi:MAG: phenylalanine--tRNA ligase subunit alpha [Candidatus Aenigmarchaeota archaeon]|nr:phenylalanine--tRNA ligase subunit alpha [Candidatus Aenigmarchaeota archaeon]